MPRRASSQFQPLWLVGLAIAVVGLVFIGRFVVTGVNDLYRTLPAIEIGTYLENSNSLRGNVYRLQGTIENSLAWSPTTGRLFSLQVDHRGSTEMLPILVPSEFNHINIQRGQEFTFRVEIGDKGMITARELSKS